MNKSDNMTLYNVNKHNYLTHAFNNNLVFWVCDKLLGNDMLIKF